MADEVCLTASITDWSNFVTLGCRLVKLFGSVGGHLLKLHLNPTLLACRAPTAGESHGTLNRMSVGGAEKLASSSS